MTDQINLVSLEDDHCPHQPPGKVRCSGREDAIAVVLVDMQHNCCAVLSAFFRAVQIQFVSMHLKCVVITFTVVAYEVVFTCSLSMIMQSHG